MMLSLTRWLLPQRCAGCHAVSDLPYCTLCLSKIPFESKSHISESGIHITSLAPYNGAMRKLLHEIKFSGHRGLADQLGLAIAQNPAMPDDAQHAVIAVPIPSVATRNAERGFHHVETLFAPLCEAWNIPLVPAVIRSKETQSLHKLGKEARWTETDHAFTVILPESIQNKRVLMLDDIVTTGATLDSMAIALMLAGVSEVSGLVLATGKRTT